ncbi:hypothetical protein ACFWA6_11835 [Streptomyces sp. NPDC060020]|uniref:hypothetical protein n=1 Tax=Streptomyces sp. NPDC060020 TaxID=3347038 RepID=UPI0036D0AF66
MTMEFAAGDFGFVPKNLAHAYRIERNHREPRRPDPEELGPPPEPYVPGPRKFATVPPERYDVRFLSGHQWRTGS